MHGNDDLSMSGLPPANGTDDRGARPLVWVAAFTKSNAERTAAAALRREDYSVYIPSRRELRQWSDRKKWVEVLLIPRVIFIHTIPKKLNDLLRNPAITSLLKAPGERKPALIPASEMEKLMFMAGNSDRTIEISAPRILRGEEVEIVRGSLKGLRGRASQDADGLRRISILIDNLCCASVSVPLSDLEAIT